MRCLQISGRSSFDHGFGLTAQLFPRHTNASEDCLVAAGGVIPGQQFINLGYALGNLTADCSSFRGVFYHHEIGQFEPDVVDIWPDSIEQKERDGMVLIGCSADRPISSMLLRAAYPTKTNNPTSRKPSRSFFLIFML